MQPTPHYGPVEIWQSMGFVGHLVLFVLLLMSVYSTGVMIDRWRLLRRAAQQSRAFLRGARRLLTAGQLPDLLSEAEKHPQSHVARIWLISSCIGSGSERRANRSSMVARASSTVFMSPNPRDRPRALTSE